MDAEISETDVSDPLAEERPSVAEYDRRQALAKMGKYAAYTAPALLVLLSAKKSDAQGACVINHHNQTCSPGCPSPVYASNCGIPL